MNVRFTILTTTMFALMACNNGQQEIAVAEDALANTQKAEEARDKSNEGNPFGAGGANFSNNVSLPTTQQGVKLNPPHGQPGHRCDIPVGAPLNSKPVKQQAPATPKTVEQQIVIDPKMAQQHTGTTEPGFSGKPNPPHGQPGHRCDIAVGAILP